MSQRTAPGQPANSTSGLIFQASSPRRSRVGSGRALLSILVLVALTLPGFVAAQGIAAQEEVSDPESTPIATHLDLRVSRIVDLWASARAHAYEPEKAPAELRPLAMAQHGLTKHIERGWGFLEGGLNGLSNMQDLLDLCGDIKTLRKRGQVVDISDEMQAIIKALGQVEGTHREKLWPGRLEKLEEKRSYLEKILIAREQQVLKYIFASLGFEDPGVKIPIYLVSQAPWPGATTYFDESQRSFSVISINQKTFQEGEALAENVLHEAIHAIDMVNEDSVLTALRARLQKAGLGFSDQAFHDIPHTLFFVQAGETIRRFVAPDHKHYGDGLSGYYRRIDHAMTEKELWIRHLDGEIALGEVIDPLVEAAKGDR